MRTGSDWITYPFGILQKVHHRVTKTLQNLHKGLCMNVECNAPLRNNMKEYCCGKCYDKAKYERSVSSSWK